MRKTTDIRTMKKIVNEYLSLKWDLMSLAVEYWNELANGYFIEHEELIFNEKNNTYYECEDEQRVYTTVTDICNECLYWLSCYYEYGNCRHDEEFNDRKAFIKFLSVFLPFTEIDIKKEFSHWEIPINNDTQEIYNLSLLHKEKINNTENTENTETEKTENKNIIGMKFSKLATMYDIVIEVLKQNKNRFLIKWTDDVKSSLGLAIVEYDNEKKEIKPIFKTYNITPDNLDNVMFNHYLATK